MSPTVKIARHRLAKWSGKRIYVYVYDVREGRATVRAGSAGRP